MVSYMGSLVCDWLLSAGDKKLAEKFRKEAKPEPLPPNSPGWLTSSSTTRRPFLRRGGRACCQQKLKEIEIGGRF